METEHKLESRALSAACALWQIQVAGASCEKMKPITTTLAALIAFSAIGPALAVPGGEIGTLPTGTYVCEIPGDAGGPYRERVPEEDFTIITASSYVAEGRRASYLMTGDRVTMTGGPFKGKKYLRVSHGVLKILDEDGNETPVRCVLTSRNNS